MRNKVYVTVENLIKEVEKTQHENVEMVAQKLADSIKNGGILQAFGSGHSYSSALDQTTPNMIQRISGIFERNPLISKEI